MVKEDLCVFSDLQQVEEHIEGGVCEEGVALVHRLLLTGADIGSSITGDCHVDPAGTLDCTDCGCDMNSGLTLQLRESLRKPMQRLPGQRARGPS